MKRLAVFCDGTWNRAGSVRPTNVVLAAKAVAHLAAGVPQIVSYNEGVGTSWLLNRQLETWTAGAFGLGLFTKIADAYRFLSFNYDPGDEVYIFGFSRGAFTARSLAGMIRKCGILPAAKITEIEKAFAFYREKDTHPDSDEAQLFRLGNAPNCLMKDSDRAWRLAYGAGDWSDTPLFRIKYLGVWDTVGALGIPEHLLLHKLFPVGRRNGFHDTKLSSIVESARHAVAIDEDRLSFTPALWDNLDELAGGGGADKYQQLWFPGDHGSVGGGGDVVGLSAEALGWVLEGAALMGLQFEPEDLKRYKKDADPFVSLHNSTAPRGWMDRFYRRGPRKGPQRRAELAPSTLLRIADERKSADWQPYRPASLGRIAGLFDPVRR